MESHSYTQRADCISRPHVDGRCHPSNRHRPGYRRERGLVDIAPEDAGERRRLSLDERRRWLDNVLAKAECLPLGLDGFPARWKSFVELAGSHMDFKEAVLKMSYYLQEDSDVQKEIFRSTAGQHGIPDVLPILELKHGLGTFRSLTCISCPDISSATSGQRNVEIEDRVEMISIFLDNGKSLLWPDLTVRGWIKCLVDGILGRFTSWIFCSFLRWT